MGKVLKIVAVGALLFTGVGAVVGGALAGLGSVGGLIAVGLEIALVGIGLQAVAGLLGLTPSQNTSEQGQQIRMAAGPAEPREYVYGKRRTGGSIVYRDTTGADNVDLWLVAVVASHEITSFDAYHVDEKVVTLSGAAVQTSPYNTFMDIHTELGTDGQAANATMVAALTNWGSNHRLRGNAYYAVKLQFDQDVYPGGIPNISVVISGKKVYDPRLDSTEGGSGSHREDDPSTWAYSANPVLCCLDYMRDSLIGPNFPWSAFSASNISAAADECDENVSVVGGGTINRYESHGVVNSEMAHAEVIQLFEKAMAGSITESGGKFRFHPGAWEASSLSLTEDDILSISATPAPSRDNLVNSVKGLFIDPDQAYQPQDYPPIKDGGEVFWLDLDLGFTTDHRMAQRISKIARERALRGMTVQVRTNLVGLGVKAMSVVDITHGNWGWTNKTFRVREWSFDPRSASVTMTLSEEDSTVYSWASGSDEQTYGAPAVPTFFSPFGVNLSLPGGFSGISLPWVGSNGISFPGLNFLYSTPGTFVQSTEMQYKLNSEAATAYRPVPSQALIGPNFAHLPVVAGFGAGLGYDVRARNLSIFGTYSDWASDLDVQIPGGAGDATAGANWNTNLTGQPQSLENLIRDPFFEGAEEDTFSSLNAQHVVVDDTLGKYPNRLTLIGNSVTNISTFQGFIPVEPDDPLYAQFAMFKTVAVNSGATARLFVTFYDKNKANPTTTSVTVNESSLSTSAWALFSSRIVVPSDKYFMEIGAGNSSLHTSGSIYIGGPKVQRAIDTDQMFNSAVEKSKIEDLAVSEPYSDVQSPSPQTMVLTQNTWDEIDGISIDATIPSGEVVDVWVLLSGSVHTEDSTGYAIDVRLLEEGVQKLLFTYAWGSNDMTTQTEGSFDFNVPLLGRFTGSGVEKTYTVEVRLVAPFFTAAGGWQAPLGFRTRDSQLVMRKVAK